ncbi:hypothetical protein DDZ13_02210 [Coraliomargarita sinensis]|uniref:Uncharacterized protein n=1 Tax=Coraliomargarita sinensis TaxID=2174842 RepID=A0A317ZNE7_9BACT|nr:hypothetical protein [Coraliomargarita sinensis]PXA05707.1 hypothetical protein DDZ13_02210 [Coraliomargarita sinensis]
MDNLLEILVPLIFAAIYFFGNMFSGKSQEDKEAPPTLNPRRDSDGPDAAERQRRIQEEIRRKIMERRRASGSGQTTSTAPSGRELRERRQQVEARRQAREEEEVRREVVEEVQKEPSAYSIPSHEMESDPESPTFTWDDSDNAYDSTMEARLKRIEETKRQAEKLQKQAAKRNNTPDQEDKQGKQQTGGYFTGTVRDSLKDPRAARVAFIYGEVLGRPISLRKEASSVPGLN